jgi:hypothetical protein
MDDVFRLAQVLCVKLTGAIGLVSGQDGILHLESILATPSPPQAADPLVKDTSDHLQPAHSLPLHEQIASQEVRRIANVLLEEPLNIASYPEWL